MFCSKCGVQIADENSTFCKDCGAPLNDSANSSQQQPVQQSQPSYQVPPIIINNINKNVNTLSSASPKNKWVTFLLCLFLGEFGIHRFYVGKIGTGVIWLLTLGLFGIGWVIDLIVILFGGFRDSYGFPIK